MHGIGTKDAAIWNRIAVAVATLMEAEAGIIWIPAMRLVVGVLEVIIEGGKYCMANLLGSTSWDHSRKMALPRE